MHSIILIPSHMKTFRWIKKGCQMSKTWQLLKAEDLNKPCKVHIMGHQSLEHRKRNPHAGNTCTSLPFTCPCTGRSARAWMQKVRATAERRRWISFKYWTSASNYLNDIWHKWPISKGSIRCKSITQQFYWINVYWFQKFIVIAQLW